MEVEEWKDIEGYEGLYQVSNLGRVRSLDKYVKGNGGKLYFKKGGTLKPGVDGGGYFYVVLSKDRVCKTMMVHRLVAEAFLPNPNNLPQVNHKDEDKKNNFVYVNDNGFVNAAKSNLEYCDYQYNNTYGTRLKRISESLKNNNCASKAVLQLDKNGNFIKEWISAALVERELGINDSSISKCCKGERKSAGNYVWKYK